MDFRYGRSHVKHRELHVVQRAIRQQQQDYDRWTPKQQREQDWFTLHSPSPPHLLLAQMDQGRADLTTYYHQCYEWVPIQPRWNIMHNSNNTITCRSYFVVTRDRRSCSYLVLEQTSNR